MSAAQRLDEVFGLPEGSEVYVLNDFKSSAYDAVRLFETLGLNQFRYIPFYPGAKDEGVARRLSRLANTTINVTICRGALKRSSMSASALSISARSSRSCCVSACRTRKCIQVTAKYVKDLIALTWEINHLNHNNESMRREMETVVQTVDEGIITLDARDNVLVFNAAADSTIIMERGLRSRFPRSD